MHPSHAPAFDPHSWNGIDLPETDRVTVSDSRQGFVLRNSRWEGATFTHPKSRCDDNGDGTWTLRFAPDSYFRITDGTRTGSITAHQFYEDRTNPLDTPCDRYVIPPVFDSAGWNEVFLPPTDLIHSSHSDLTFGLNNSRWEGAVFQHPEGMCTDKGGGVWALRFPANWDFRISDGKADEPVTAQDFFEDRSHPLDQPGEPYVCTPTFIAGAWNTLYAPSSDVTAMPGSEAVTVRLTNSRWEGLNFTHPASLVDMGADGRVAIRFGPDWQFKLFGGDEVVAPSSRELWGDRNEPPSEPQESLATPVGTWYSLTFADGHATKLGRRKIPVWRIRFPWHTELSDAAIYHPAKLCKSSRRDGETVLTIRFHGAWAFTAKHPGEPDVEMGVEEFVAAVEPWARDAPRLSNGIRRTTPEALKPATSITIVEELLDTAAPTTSLKAA